MVAISVKLVLASALAFGLGGLPAAAQKAPAKAEQTVKRPNIIFILNDDQRYDAMGFLNPELKTPNMDFLAKNGVHFKNAFVTTALCSPSRASILTGQYMHNHGIADNNVKFAPGTFFFPQALQEAGYATGFIGKWHMGGETDSPQPGFDKWISFKGQGNYLPDDGKGKRYLLNIDGRRVEQQGYITDELNKFALEFVEGQGKDKPFFLYLSHKAVHADFIPAKRHEGLYAGQDIKLPDTMADTPQNYDGKPMWVKNQRNSWHGVDFPYHSTLDIKEYKRRYYQTLGAVDDGIGEILKLLRKKGMLENTLIVMMGDNGFMFGEHGLIDKRNAYEESMRVPLIAFSGGAAKGKVVNDVVANIDIAPTFLALAGVKSPDAKFDGMSFLGQLTGGATPANWRRSFNYEYYWEYNYPHTPTTFAIRTDRYKLIQYHGVWDTEELYDLQSDPRETRNLIANPELQQTVKGLREQLFASLDAKDGRATVTFTERYGVGAVLRSRTGSKAAEFPEAWLRDGNEADLKAHTKNEGGKRANSEAH